MPNPVLILSYNQLPLLQRCIKSVRAQDIPTSLYVVDNGSTDGSREWLGSDEYEGIAAINSNNTGVSKGWNQGLRHIFATSPQEGYHHIAADHCLVLNQDVILPPFFYRELLNCQVPLVTGYPVETMEELGKFRLNLTPAPCFSAFLIRRKCWETVGPFDERLWSWAGDCAYHVEGHQRGVSMQKAEIPFFHQAGTTMRTASPEEREWFGRRAEADRETFKSIYGCKPDDPQYALLFIPELFGSRKVQR